MLVCHGLKQTGVAVPFIALAIAPRDHVLEEDMAAVVGVCQQPGFTLTSLSQLDTGQLWGKDGLNWPRTAELSPLRLALKSKLDDMRNATYPWRLLLSCFLSMLSLLARHL